MIEPIAVILALVGAYLVGSSEQKMRYAGFCIWIFSNALWVVHGIQISDVWIMVQFGAFLLVSARGIQNNRVIS